MLAPVRKGAHPERHLAAPAADVVDGWSRDAGCALATIAPELPGALDVIATLVGRGVVVSIGHTDARPPSSPPAAPPAPATSPTSSTPCDRSATATRDRSAPRSPTTVSWPG